MLEMDQILHSVRYVVDEDGRRRAVQLDLSVWEQIVAWLEELDDEAEMREALAAEDESIDWEEAKKLLRSDGVDL